VTTLLLGLERTRRRQDEQMHASFLLRALGESAGVVSADASNTRFLIDVLSSLSASYSLAFTDEHTSRPELADYLAFARDLGLEAQGASLSALERVLPRADGGDLGRMAATYDVRFGAAAIEALLSLPGIGAPAELAIRTAMRKIVLSNYLKSDAMHDVAFAYASPAVFARFRDLGFASFISGFEQTFAIAIGDTRIAAPASVVLDRIERQLLADLYDIENAMVKAIKSLYGLLRARRKIDPRTFEDKLASFGDALLRFDRFDQVSNGDGVGTSSIFVMFDALVRLASGGSSAAVAVLHLESEAAGKKVEKIFMSAAAAAGD
jgi:hypothetical protein